MPEINPIQVNITEISQKNSEIKEKENSKAQTNTNVDVKPETKQLSEKEIFAFMDNYANLAKTNINMTSSNSIDKIVAKYNSPEAIARIGEMMNSFEGKVVEGLQIFNNEFGAIPEYQNLSDSDKLALAAKYTLDN